MNKQQIDSIYQKQLDGYLQAIIFLKIERDVKDFEILPEGEGFRFEFFNRPSLDVFVLKVLSVLNHVTALPVFILVENNVAMLNISDLGGE